MILKRGGNVQPRHDPSEVVNKSKRESDPQSGFTFELQKSPEKTRTRNGRTHTERFEGVYVPTKTYGIKGQNGVEEGVRNLTDDIQTEVLENGVLRHRVINGMSPILVTGIEKGGLKTQSFLSLLTKYDQEVHKGVHQTLSVFVIKWLFQTRRRRSNFLFCLDPTTTKFLF